MSLNYNRTLAEFFSESCKSFADNNAFTWIDCLVVLPLICNSTPP
jgi:hypothetical protein